MLHSVANKRRRENRGLAVNAWTWETIPWREIAGPLSWADDLLGRLDERLAKSPIREGWIARSHYSEACDGMWLAGELVHLEDLVLHNERMDLRSPTHELTRAHALFRARQRIAGEAPDWALSPGGLALLRGKGEAREKRRATEELVEGEVDRWPDEAGQDDLSAEFAALDAAMSRTSRLLAGEALPEKSELVYEPGWDEERRLEEWRAVVRRAADLPPVLATAIALDAWERLDPLQHLAWLGPVLCCALLRQQGRAKAHLPCISAGMKTIAREKRRSRDPAVRLVARVDAIAAAAEKGLADHDRWALARAVFQRKLEGRRSTSKLADLIELTMARPLVTAGMIGKALSITPRAAQNLVADLGLREATGRERYRAWGLL